MITETKKIGRPATGLGTLVGVRLDPSLLEYIDWFRAAQNQTLTRPQAIRMIMKSSMKGRNAQVDRKTLELLARPSKYRDQRIKVGAAR